MGAIGLTTPSEIALAIAALVLHVFLTPSPQAVKDILLAKLHCNHHSVRHAFGSSILVLNVAYVTHRVAHLEVDFVRTTENLVEHLMQLGFYLSMMVAHLCENIAILSTH